MGRRDTNPGDARGANLPPAGHGQPKAVGATATDPGVAIDCPDRPVDLPDRSIGFEFSVIVRVAEGDPDGLQVRLECVGLVRRLAELDGVVVHRVIVPS